MARFCFRKLMFKVCSFFERPCSGVCIFDSLQYDLSSWLTCTNYRCHRVWWKLWVSALGFHSNIFQFEKRCVARFLCFPRVSGLFCAHGSFSRRKSCFRPLGAGTYVFVKKRPSQVISWGVFRIFHQKLLADEWFFQMGSRGEILDVGNKSQLCAGLLRSLCKFLALNNVSAQKAERNVSSMEQLFRERRQFLHLYCTLQESFSEESGSLYEWHLGEFSESQHA